MEWDKVFTTGRHTDSSGNVKVWTTKDLDRMVASFNPSYHEPPVVIGHPSDNAPAYGWVSGIKRIGNDLYLSYKDVSDQFKEWMAQGHYKKKSIAVYPDGSLRHVGYLGAMPPAIKGLPDFQFQSGQEFSTYEMCDQVELGFWRRLKNWMIGKEGQEQAEALLPEYELELLTRQAYQPDDPETDTITPSFTETKEESMKSEEVQELVTKAVTEATQQFSEAMGKTIKGLETQIAELKKGQEGDREAGLRREFREFLMTPEMQKRVSDGSREATINQMMTLAGAEPVQFGEGDGKTTKPALDVYKDQLKALPEVVAFGEHATKDKAGDVTVNGMDAQTLSQKAVEFQEAEAKAGRTVSMTDAVNHVKKGGK